MKKPTKKTLRNKADKLLQDYIRAKYKYCLVCAEPVTCGHHYFPVSNSLATRYYLPNIIPICRECHCLVHAQPHLVNPKIDFLMGKEWYDDLIAVKRQGAKFTKEWITFRVDELQSLLTQLEKA